MSEISKEESKLRDWMAENCKNYNPDRSIFEVALECLLTYKANAQYYAEREHLHVILRDFKGWGEWFVTKAPEIKNMVDKIQELEINLGKTNSH